MKDESLKNVGKRIKEIRKSKQMSLQDVAQKSDVTAGLLSKIENFRTVPSLPVLLNISRALGVNMAELVQSVINEAKPVYQYFPMEEKVLEIRSNGSGWWKKEMASISVERAEIDTQMIQLAPGKEVKSPANQGTKLLHIVSGTISFLNDIETLDLKEKDSI